MSKDNGENKNNQENFNSLCRDISNLKFELNSINEENEKWFKEKEDLKHKVLDLIKKTEKKQKKEKAALAKS